MSKITNLTPEEIEMLTPIIVDHLFKSIRLRLKAEQINDITIERDEHETTLTIDVDAEALDFEG